MLIEPARERVQKLQHQVRQLRCGLPLGQQQQQQLCDSGPQALAGIRLNNLFPVALWSEGHGTARPLFLHEF